MIQPCAERCLAWCLVICYALGHLTVGSQAESHALAVPQFNITEASAKCDRAAARTVRRIIEQYVLGPHKMRVEHLPSECPLHPDNDMLWEHEHHKRDKNQAHKQCTYCKKVFKSELFLDKHLQRKHVDQIPPGARSCISDLCDVLHCNWFAPGFLRPSQRKKAAASKAQAPRTLRDEHCLPQEMANTRHKCQELGNLCFPIRMAEGTHHHALKEPSHHEWDNVHEFWNSHFCQASTCAAGQKDTLLAAVVACVRPPQHTALVILLGILACMLALALLLCYIGSADPSLRKSASVDPSGKTKRRPAGFTRAASSFQQGVPYVAKRPGSGTAITAGVMSGSTGLASWMPTVPVPHPGGLLAAGQQMLASMSSSSQQPLTQPLTSSRSSMAQPLSPMSPSHAAPPTAAAASPQVLHGSSTAAHAGMLHQRAGGGGFQQGASGTAAVPVMPTSATGPGGMYQAAGPPSRYPAGFGSERQGAYGAGPAPPQQAGGLAAGRGGVGPHLGPGAVSGLWQQPSSQVARPPEKKD